MPTPRRIDTTPAPDRIELTDPDAYIAKLTKLLGQRDPLEVLAQTPIALAKIVEQVPAATLRRRPFPGKWTPNEILGHLADIEWVFGYRTRSIVCDDNPSILWRRSRKMGQRPTPQRPRTGRPARRIPHLTPT